MNILQRISWAIRRDKSDLSVTLVRRHAGSFRGARVQAAPWPKLIAEAIERDFEEPHHEIRLVATKRALEGPLRAEGPILDFGGNCYLVRLPAPGLMLRAYVRGTEEAEGAE